jgi:hypothetical protein
MYVERLTPVDGPLKQYPIVFIHGSDQTATVQSPFSESSHTNTTRTG